MIGKTDISVEILHVQPGFTRCTYTAKISSGARQTYRDQQLINIVDAGGDLTQADHSCNFGGYITPMPGGVYKVVVYTD